MNAHIREEAARWLIEFRADEADASTRQAFAAWLRASPKNVEEYLKLAAVWEEGGQIPFPSRAGLDELIRVARASDGDVVDIHSAEASVTPPRASRVPAPRYLLAAAVASIATAGAITAWVLQNDDPVYATELGEQRTLALADGSTVELNALSSIRVHVTKAERRVELLRGQALFRLVHDGARPFVVRSGAINVRDLGTEFDVARGVSGTTVTVVEGRVEVVPSEAAASGAGASGADAIVEISAGEQVTVAPGRPPRSSPRPHRANVATATAWTQQQLIFESTPLADAAEEFNRFNVRQLRVEGAALADFHVSGSFPARDPASLSRFVLFLREQPGIEVQESDDEILVRQK